MNKRYSVDLSIGQGISSFEQVVTFRNSNDETLIGILHSPPEEKIHSPKIGVNLLNPGLKNRVGPHRLNVKIARKLAAIGYYVLRFDPAGIGDSEGALPKVPVIDIWGDIQRGVFVSDTLCSNDFFISTCSLDQLFLVGSCGGAVTSMLTAVKDERVSGTVLIDIPVLLSSTKTAIEDNLRIITIDKNFRNHMSSYYFNSIFSLSSLKRFFSFQSDYSAIFKIIMIKIKEIINNNSMSIENIDTDLPNNFNKLIVEALMEFFSSDRHVLFLCAEKDSDTKLFEKWFRHRFLQKWNKFEKQYKIVTISNANHIYTLTASQEALMYEIELWLKMITGK